MYHSNKRYLDPFDPRYPDSAERKASMTAKYRMTTQRQIRRAFWQDHAHLPGITKRKITDYSGNGKMHNTDTRYAFADYVDYLSKNGDISQELAERVTL